MLSSRYAAFFALSLCIACGGANTTAPNASNSTTTSPKDSSGGEQEQNRGVAPAEPQTSAEAREEADKRWQAAETSPQDPAGWNAAAEALAIAAKLETEAEAQLKLLRGALAGWERADSVAPPPSKREPAQGAPLSPRETARISVLEQLTSHLKPDDAEVGRIAYRRGRIRWNAGHYDRAIPRFDVVVKRFPASAEAEYAATLLLDSLLRRGDFDGVRTRVSAMLKRPSLLSDRPQLKYSLLKLRHQGGLQQATQLADAKNFAECARAFLALHVRDKSLPDFRGDHLLNNASVCQERDGKIAAAIKSLRKLVKLYPHSAMAPKARERADALRRRR